jgi:antitoxin (DNA-binding transcriptional repressor) of toxin-antitoxin stability system
MLWCTLSIEIMYVIYYADIMQVTITKLRQDLFRLMDKVLSGETVQFTYKGATLQVVPENQTSKLSRLTRQTVTAPGGDVQLFKEMEEEWVKDWAEL